MVESQKVPEGRFLSFQVNGENYGVPIRSVREINQLVSITPVPLAPEYLKGVINLRGKIIPVISMRVKLGEVEVPDAKETCIIIMECDGTQVGAIVDKVHEVVDLKNQEIEPPPLLSGAQSRGYISGLGRKDGKILILMDTQELLKEQAPHEPTPEL